MFKVTFLMKFFDRNFLVKFLLLTLLYTLLPLGEIFLLIHIGDVLGNYLMLALAASTGLIGVSVALLEVRKILDDLKAKVKASEYPGQEFIALAGIFVGALFLLSPGFITDFLGFLMFFPFIRNGIGKLITKRMSKNLNEIYEYLKLYEI